VLAPENFGRQGVRDGQLNGHRARPHTPETKAYWVGMFRARDPRTSMKHALSRVLLIWGGILAGALLLGACGSDSGGQGAFRSGGCYDSCEDAGAECGIVVDACGTTLSCGYCILGETCGGGEGANECGPEPCVPRGCETEECGTVSDGCADVMECKPEGCSAGYECTKSVCTCAPESSEPNDTVNAPADLGTLDDSGGRQELTLSPLTLSGTDLDRFHLAVVDEHVVTIKDAGVNPRVTIRPVGTIPGQKTTFVVELFYSCINGGESHTCSPHSTASDKGCKATIQSGGDRSIWLKANCSGADDSGTASVAISQDCGERQGCSDECHPYRLEYSVEPYRELLSVPF